MSWSSLRWYNGGKINKRSVKEKGEKSQVNLSRCLLQSPDRWEDFIQAAHPWKRTDDTGEKVRKRRKQRVIAPGSFFRSPSVCRMSSVRLWKAGKNSSCCFTFAMMLWTDRCAGSASELSVIRSTLAALQGQPALYLQDQRSPWRFLLTVTLSSDAHSDSIRQWNRFQMYEIGPSFMHWSD